MLGDSMMKSYRGPIYAVPKLLKQHGLKIDHIGLWELNEAFAIQCLSGHSYGISAAHLTGHALLEGRRRGVRYVVVTMCVSGEMGSAGLFEIA